MIDLLKTAFSSHPGILACLTQGMFAWGGAALSKHGCSMHPPSHIQAGIFCWEKSHLLVHHIALLQSKASQSHPARGGQIWLSEGFTPAGLNQAYPTTALDLLDTSDSSSLLLPGRPLVVADNITLAPDLPRVGSKSCFSNIVHFSELPIPAFLYLTCERRR